MSDASRRRPPRRDSQWMAVLGGLLGAALTAALPVLVTIGVLATGAASLLLLVVPSHRARGRGGSTS